MDYGAGRAGRTITLPDAPDPVETRDVNEGKPKFEVGDVWSYASRPDETASTVTVLMVETDAKLGPVVHVSVTNIRMKNPRAPGGFSSSIAHMPFAESALEASVTKRMAQHVTLPDFRNGYAQWRSALDKGNAGIFTISVAEAIDTIERAMNP